MGREDDMMDALAGMAKDTAGHMGKSFEKLGHNLSFGMMPKDVLGVSDGSTEKMYARAFELYNSGKYTEAKNMFQTLCMLDITESKFLFGLAAATHRLKDYESAAEYYMKCAMIMPNDPMPYYHASDCYMEMGDKVATIVSLNMVVQRSGEKEEYKVIKDRAALSLSKLLEEIKVEGAI